MHPSKPSNQSPEDSDSSETGIPSIPHLEELPPLSPEMHAVFGNAALIAANHGSNTVNTLHVLASLMSLKGTSAYKELQTNGELNYAERKVADHFSQINPRSTPQESYPEMKLSANVRACIGPKTVDLLVDEAFTQLEPVTFLKRLRQNTNCLAGQILQDARKHKPEWSVANTDEFSLASKHSDLQVAVTEIAEKAAVAASAFFGNVPGIIANVKNMTLTFSWGNATVSEKKDHLSFENDTMVFCQLRKLQEEKKGTVAIVGGKKHALNVEAMFCRMVAKNDEARKMCEDMVNKHGNEVIAKMQLLDLFS